MSQSVAYERPSLRLIRGEGQRARERLTSRDAIVRVLIGAGADLLLRRISSVRAHEIEVQVEKILALFDRVDDDPALFPVLQSQIEALEALVRESPPRTQ